MYVCMDGWMDGWINGSFQSLPRITATKGVPFRGQKGYLSAFCVCVSSYVLYSLTVFCVVDFLFFLVNFVCELIFQGNFLLLLFGSLVGNLSMLTSPLGFSFFQEKRW